MKYTFVIRDHSLKMTRTIDHHFHSFGHCFDFLKRDNIEFELHRFEIYESFLISDPLTSDLNDFLTRSNMDLYPPINFLQVITTNSRVQFNFSDTFDTHDTNKEQSCSSQLSSVRRREKPFVSHKTDNLRFMTRQYDKKVKKINFKHTSIWSL